MSQYLQGSQWLQLRQALQDSQSMANKVPLPATPALVRGPPVVLKDDALQQSMWASPPFPYSLSVLGTEIFSVPVNAADWRRQCRNASCDLT